MLDCEAIEHNPIRHCVGAFSVGIVDGTPMLDLCYEEDSRVQVDMNVVMTCNVEDAELQATPERRTHTRYQLDAQLKLAPSRIQSLTAAQRKLVEFSKNT